MPIELEQIVNKALAKDPNERYQHLDEFIVDLKQMKKEPEKYKTETPKWRLPAYIFGVVLIGLLLYKVWPGMKNVLQFRSVPSKQHLLVLPLADLSADSSKQAFCDGLAETMTSKLTQMEQFHGSLWVVPFSEVRSNRIKSSGEAYQYFGVNLVITGSIQFVSDVFRLTLNLVDAKNLRQINSAVIDIHSANIFSIQDQSIIKIMDMLRLRLNPKSSNVLQAGGTVIPKAYELYLQGRGYLQRGFESEKNYDLAIDFFRRATVEDSHYTIAYSAIGEAYWRKYEASEDQRLVEKALDACQKALEVDSTEISIYYTLGLIRAGTGRYDDAIRDFNRFLKGAPTDSEALIGLASAYQGKGLLDEAEKLFKNAINLKSDYWAGYSHLGVFYYRQNRYEDAINPFQRVIQLTPDNYNGYNNLGATYYMLERWSEAREMFEQAFNLREYYGVASNLGTLNFFEGKYADAARWFEKALEINDYDYLIWGNLASAYSMIPGRGDESVKKYQQAIIKGKLALNLNPNNATILARLAGYYASIGERSESLSFIDKSLLYSQNEASIFFEIGSTYETLGDREMAIQYLIEALKGGYSVSAIETDPMLSQLLTDKRFQQLRSF
jgi:serine/threonine-protein kinase